jgi:hypothetical protein
VFANDHGARATPKNVRTGSYVIALQFRVVGQNLVDLHASRDHVQDDLDGSAHIPYAWLAVADSGIKCDSIQNGHGGIPMASLRSMLAITAGIDKLILMCRRASKSWRAVVEVRTKPAPWRFGRRPNFPCPHLLLEIL